MSIDLFRRGLKWRAAVNQKLEKRRAELLIEDPHRQVPNASFASSSVDSYWEYRRLVGESDGGTLLGEEEYAELRKLAAKAAKNRLFVTWRNMATGMDCYNVGPDSRCHCGHSYKAHAWYNTDTKRVHCRCAGCACTGFEYVVGHGAWWIKCVCKHTHHDHANGRGRCAHDGCPCQRFHSSFSCVCGTSWQEHATVIEARSERRASNRPVHNLCGGGGVGEAACGAVTRMSSLVPGIDRIETPLPFTDAGFFAHRLPSHECSGSGSGSEPGSRRLQGAFTAEAMPPSGDGELTRQMLLDTLPDESLHVLLELLEEPTEAELQRAEEEAAQTAQEESMAQVPRDREDKPRAKPQAQAAVATITQAGASDGEVSRKAAPAARRPGQGGDAPKGKAGMPRSAVLKAHDDELNREIAELTAKLESAETSAATKHGLKKQLAMKKAALKRDVVALAGR